MSKFHNRMCLSVLTTELKLGTECKNEKSNLLSSNEMANNQLQEAFRSCAIQDMTVKQRAPLPRNRDSHTQPCNSCSQSFVKPRCLGSFKPLESVYLAGGIIFFKFQGDSDELLAHMTHQNLGLILQILESKHLGAGKNLM